MATHRVLGVMSGSSLDGLDLALCCFQEDQGRWKHTIEDAVTVPFGGDTRGRLMNAMRADGLELARLHRDLGIRIGEASRDFLAGRHVDLIASHGHTIFHQPAEGLTLQAGCGAHIAALTGRPTACDFRTLDVALGGQGAPLVPMGELLLFPDHRAFLNIGGICNISMHIDGNMTGYDVCIGNQALNELAAEAGMPYDAQGALARTGRIMQDLLYQLDALPFHQQAPPRSLGREWFEASLAPLIRDRATPVADRLRTVVEHIAGRTSQALAHAKGPVLVTGGGAFNTFLTERIRALAAVTIEVPAPELVSFKEALVFALLGLLRWLGRPNTLASVTGAAHHSSGGALYMPN
ncbi:MAG: anhydro-N-acetylmuramic acid kinase [Flavobacteriales bacterium]|nr:anhydro-N-acetylmuramic acid kinase [Flavobacteriales bacterium]